MKLPQKIAKEATISFMSMGFGSGIGYLFVLILARWVGPVYLGVFSLASALMRFAEVIGKAGLDIGVMKYVTENLGNNMVEEGKAVIRSSIKMGFILSLISAAILIILSKWLAIDVFTSGQLLRQVLICNAIGLPFSVTMLIIAGATQAFKLLKYKALVINIIVPIMNLIAMLIGLQISNQVAITIPILFSSIIGFGFIFYFLQRFVTINLNDVKTSVFRVDLLIFSYPLMFVTIIGTAMHWMDIYMLGYFFDNTTVGLYHPSARTAGLLRMILVAFTGIFTPIIADLFAKKDQSSMVHLYQLVVRWIMTISIPLFLLIIVFPTKVMLLFGPQYQESHKILAILTTAVLIQSFIGPSGPTLTMTGFPKINFMNSIAVLIVNLFFNIILIPAYAGFGAAIATLISMSFLGLLRTIEVWYILKLQPVSVTLFKPVMAGIVTWILLTQIKFIIMPFHTVITLVAATIVVVFSFFILLLLMGFDDDDKQVVSALKATWASNFRNSK